MTRMIVLARGDGRYWRDISGRSILSDLPLPVVVFTDRLNARYFADIGGEAAIEIVRWSNLPEVARRVHEVAAAVPVSGLAALDETLIEFAAELRAELGLSGMQPEEGRRFRNKVVMKELLKAAGLRVPEHALCDARGNVEALLAEHDRIVIKPVSGLGSRGVTFIDTRVGLDAWYRENSGAGFEAEEFIDGTLYHINAVVRDRAPILTVSAPYLPGMANIDFAAGTPFVSVVMCDSALRTRLEEFSDAVIATLGLRDGVTHMECFVTSRGEIVFCEIAARPAGGGLVWMMEAQHGVNYARAVLLLEAGAGDRLAPSRTVGRATTALMGFRSARGGIIQRTPNPEDFAEPWVHLRQFESEGDFKAPAAHCTDYVGLLVFSAPDDGPEFERRRRQLYDRFYEKFELQAL